MDQILIYTMRMEIQRNSKNIFLSFSILLILDDVDGVDEVDAAVPNQYFIHSDSLIFITSRNEDVLTNSV